MVSALVPFAVAAFLVLTGPRLGRLLPPATAARLLTAAALMTALSCGLVLSLLAFDGLARLPELATAGHWSTAPGGTSPPVAAGIGLALLVAALLVASSARLAAVVRDLACAERTCRLLGPGVAGLVVVPSGRPDAYTLPGWRGRIVVSAGMLAALPAEERAVLLAHEASHLRHRHHLYVQLADLAAVANPLLRRLAGVVAVVVERWADEDAAAAAADRRVVARALARASLVSRAPAGPAAALGAARIGVVDRTLAMLAPPPSRQRLLSALATALVVLPAVGAAGAWRATEHQFEQAQVSYASAAAGM